MVTWLREEAPGIEKDILEQIRRRDGKWLSEHVEHAAELPQLIHATLKHCFNAIEGDVDRPLPPEATTHARRLAETVLQTERLSLRYTDCSAVFMERLRQANLSVKSRSDAGFADAQKRTEHFFRRLLDLVTGEHRDELEQRKRSRKDRAFDRVTQLLSGELIYPPEDLGYDFSATHIGVVGSGPSVEGEIRRLAQILGGETLIVQDSPSKFWAWIGLKLENSAARVDDVLKAECDPAVCIARGEPVVELEGWRQTHQEAEAAFPVAIHRPGSVVRYRSVALLAALARDTLACTTLYQAYLDPLTNASESGQVLRETLHAYFAAQYNVSSTAAAIKVSRKTVRNRLNVIEGRIGRPISEVSLDLQAAIHLQQCSLG